MILNVEDADTEVVNIKMSTQDPKQTVAVAQIKLAPLAKIQGKIEFVPLINKLGQQTGQVNFETQWIV